MNIRELNDSLERCPIIAAINEHNWKAALSSPVEILFYLKANINTLPEKIKEAHENAKIIFVHIDLAEGLAKDKAGLEYLSKLGCDGVLTTRSQTIRHARDIGLLSVQRCFALDSQGTSCINDLLEVSSPDTLEIMPGVIGKVIERFSGGKTPVIAGGLIETKEEVTTALSHGAAAVSTGKQELWYI